MVKESMLAAGEKVIFTAHSHWKNLAVPALVTVLTITAVLLGLLVAFPDPQTQAWQRWLVAGAAAVVVVALGVWPLLGWLASTDTLTTRRLISRRGVLSREGREIPVDRVQSVSYRRTLLDRMLGCGTLIVQTAGETSDVELLDVAKIERRILQVQELLLRAEIPAEGAPPVQGEHGDDVEPGAPAHG
jgi:uncharacterized membrane protein YdbT with pleckstrin-like domain